jgi:hypothetical protein
MNAFDPYCQMVLKTALALAAEGIAVFPCVYGQKEPATKRGFYDASTNPATIRRWFGGSFKKNLAVRTGQASGVWILDVDDLNALSEIDALPTTRVSGSARGFHYWFRTTPLPIPCSTGRVAKGIDVKSENGYVVCPPSIHPDGPTYRWLNDAPIVEAPSWLLVLATKPTPAAPPARAASASLPAVGARAYGLAALRSEIETLTSAPKGSRNHQLNRASFSLSQLVAAGELVASDVESALIEAAVSNGLVAEDGMQQCLATIRSGARAGLQSPRNRGDRP